MVLAAACSSELRLLRDIVIWDSSYDPEGGFAGFADRKTAFEQRGVDFIMLGMDKGEWTLHNSLGKYRQPLAGSIWGCPLAGTDSNPRSDMSGERTPVKFHGAFDAYHHPFGWSKTVAHEHTPCSGSKACDQPIQFDFRLSQCSVEDFLAHMNRGCMQTY